MISWLRTIFRKENNKDNQYEICPECKNRTLVKTNTGFVEKDTFTYRRRICKVYRYICNNDRCMYISGMFKEK